MGDPDLDETLYYCNDANMNVTALVNTSGTVVERYLYDPYGAVKVYSDDWSTVVTTWAASKKNNIRYCGHFFDDESGLYHVRHRSYHPTLGSWTTRDMRGYINGMKLYEYAISSPADVFDPLGLTAEVKWVESNKPEDAQPRWESQEELDKGVTPEDKAVGLEHCDGCAWHPLYNDTPGYGYDFKQGCCFCWFDGILTVRIDYDFSLLKDLKDPKTDKEKARRKRAEDHERGHLAEDAAIPFRDPALRKPLIDEVAAHDTQQEAYRIDKWAFVDPKTREVKSKGISTRGQCAIGCAQHLLRVIDQKLEPMWQAIKSRGAARDERDYRADARKRAAEKKKPEKQ